MSKYNIVVGESSHEIMTDDLQKLDIYPKDNNSFHLLYHKVKYDVQIVHHDQVNKKLELLVNGARHIVQIQDEYDLIVDQMGLSAVSESKITDIKSPMPGLIVDVLIKAGDEVEKGDGLIILEAMKMENVLKAEGSGVVKSIEINKSDAVEKGQVLIIME